MEPDGLILILDEDGFHSQDLLMIQLLHVVAHLVDLLEAVPVLVTPNQLNVIAERLVVVLDSQVTGCRALDVCKEMDNNRRAAANLRLDRRHDIDDVAEVLILRALLRAHFVERDGV